MKREPLSCKTHTTELNVYYSKDGDILGAGPLWIPADYLKQNIEPGQKEIKVTFDGDDIRITNEKKADTGKVSATNNGQIEGDDLLYVHKRANST